MADYLSTYTNQDTIVVNLSLWRDKSFPISFILVTHYFGIKSIGKQEVLQLIETFQSKHVISIDYSESNYLGFNIHWDCVQRHVTLSMT